VERVRGVAVGGGGRGGVGRPLHFQLAIRVERAAPPSRTRENHRNEAEPESAALAVLFKKSVKSAAPDSRSTYRTHAKKVQCAKWGALLAPYRQWGHHLLQAIPL